MPVCANWRHGVEFAHRNGRGGPPLSTPCTDGQFDRVVSQLVVNFMADPEAGVREMRRVVRPGGTVAACVWDYQGEMTLLRRLWDAAVALDPAARRLDEGVVMRHCDPGSLGALWARARFGELRPAVLTPSVRYRDFDDLWRSLLGGAGPASAYASALDAPHQAALRHELHRHLGAPSGPFVITARAWAVAGTR